MYIYFVYIRVHTLPVTDNPDGIDENVHSFISARVHSAGAFS